MNGWAWIGWCVAGCGALYGLHRLALWLEEHGHLYYLRRSPKGGGAAGSFVALQRIIEPQAQNVLQVQDEANVRGIREAEGGDPPEVDDEPRDVPDARSRPSDASINGSP